MRVGLTSIFLFFFIVCLHTVQSDVPNGNVQDPLQNIDVTPEGKTSGTPNLNNQNDQAQTQGQGQVEPAIPEMQKEADPMSINDGNKKNPTVNDNTNTANDATTVKEGGGEQKSDEKANFKMIYDSFDPYEDYHENDDSMKKHRVEYDHMLDNDDDYEHDEIPLDRYDFDPSEGLSFLVNGRSAECFYEEIKHTGDKLEGAYIVLAEEPELTFTITSPSKETLYHRKTDGEGEYSVKSKELGIFKLCFLNEDRENKLVTHVTNTLQSQHPVQKEHVDNLSKYVSHIDIRLGELESEQRLLQLRADRHLKIQEKMNLNVSFYAVVICVFYLLVCWAQNYYIQRLLENPYRAIPTSTQPASRRWA